MKRIILSLAVIVLVAAAAVSATRAFFSDTETSTENTFTSGTLSIDNDKLTTATAFTLPNMAPGDVTGEYSLVIENNGSINLAWLGDWQFDGGVSGEVDLKDALYVDYAKMEFLSPSDTVWLDDSAPGYEPDGADLFVLNGVGHGPYPTEYNALAALSEFNVLTFKNFDNNSGMIPDSVYEHTGALKPGYKYKLTVKFGMAPLAGNDYQGLGTVTVKLQVKATQINADALESEGVPAASAPGLVTWMNNQITDQTE